VDIPHFQLAFVARSDPGRGPDDFLGHKAFRT
jgi:hypothetical protein